MAERAKLLRERIDNDLLDIIVATGSVVIINPRASLAQTNLSRKLSLNSRPRAPITGDLIYAI